MDTAAETSAFPAPQPRDGEPRTPELAAAITHALELERNAKAPNTRRAYAADWADFEAWCARHRFVPFPAADRIVQLYLQWLAYARHTEPHDREPHGARHGPLQPLKLTTIERRLASIAAKHHQEGLLSPTNSPHVQNTWDAIRRELHARRSTPKRAMQAEELRELVGSIGCDQPADIRDRALLLVTFLGAFRRSEVAALQVADLSFDLDGVSVQLRTSKTNQLGTEIERVAIVRNPDPALCAVRSLEDWLARAHIREGPVFRNLVRGTLGAALSDKSIYAIVRGRVLDVLCAWLARNAAGDVEVKTLQTKQGRFVHARFTDPVLDGLLARFALPAMYDPRTVGAHSLRSGFVTSARRRRHPDYAIKKQTRHKTTAMLDRYTHSMELYDDNASRGLLQ